MDSPISAGEDGSDTVEDNALSDNGGLGAWDVAVDSNPNLKCTHDKRSK